MAPTAPHILPAEEQDKWKKTYAAAREEAQKDFPEDESAQHQAALKEANRMLRAPKITSAEQAEKLPAHLFVKREVVGDELRILTIDAKKYRFKVSVKKGKGKDAENPPSGDDKNPPPPA